MVNAASYRKPMTIDFGKRKYIKVFDEDQIFNMFNTYGTETSMVIDGNTGKGKIEHSF